MVLQRREGKWERGERRGWRRRNCGPAEGARTRLSPDIRCTESASRVEMEVQETLTSSSSSGSAEDFTNDDVEFVFMFFFVRVLSRKKLVKIKRRIRQASTKIAKRYSIPVETKKRLWKYLSRSTSQSWTWKILKPCAYYHRHLWPLRSILLRVANFEAFCRASIVNLNQMIHRGWAQRRR